MELCESSNECFQTDNQCCYGFWDATNPDSGITREINTWACVKLKDLDEN